MQFSEKKARHILDELWQETSDDKSFSFGKSIAYEEINELLYETTTERSLMIKINRAIKNAENERAEALDNEDFQCWSGEIEGYKSFKKALKAK